MAPSPGENNKFYELSDKMFFNIFIHKPDEAVFDFVKKYFPFFAVERQPGGWAIYPPGPIPEFQNTVHSLLFTRHPYFDANFREGRLDILASEEGDRCGLKDFQLWFMFDVESDAIKAFTLLSGMFEKLSKSKRESERNGRKIVEYSDQAEFDEINSVQIILTKDELHDDKYKLFFRIGSFTYAEQ